MPKLWFLLGREPLLSAAEIISFLKKEKRTSQSLFFNPPLLTLLTDALPSDLISNLGGTIKIGEEIASALDEETLIAAMEKVLKRQAGKITFGISYHSGDAGTVENWGKRIKKNLKAEGLSVRYVFNKEPTLSSVTVDKNKLVNGGSEFLVFKTGQRFALAATKAVQPFESFSARDYGRPGRDSASGMLPPKLAMMLINLALPQKNETILDPFCGSGTILTEAVLMGYKNLIGADQSERAVADTLKNLEWTKQQVNNSAATKVLQADVQTLSQSLEKNSVDVIATEPYLGKPFKGAEETKELLALYKNAFSEFKKILRPGGRVVFIIPRFLVRGAWLSISNDLRSHAESLGFKVDHLVSKELSNQPFILYSRPNQYVGREIWRFIA